MTRFPPHVNSHLFYKYCDTEKNPSTILPVVGRWLDYNENVQVRRELEEVKQNAVGAHFDKTSVAPYYGQALLLELYLNSLLTELLRGEIDEKLEDLEETVDIARANCQTIADFMPKSTVLSLPLVNGVGVDFIWEDWTVYYMGKQKIFLGNARTQLEFKTVIQRNLQHMLLHLFSDVED